MKIRTKHPIQTLMKKKYYKVEGVVPGAYKVTNDDGTIMLVRTECCEVKK